MKTLTRKVSELEKNVLSDIPKPEDTYLGTNNNDELELFRRANRIQEEQKRQATELQEKTKANPTVDYTAEMKAILELSEENQTIVDQSNLIYVQRVMHLFDNAIAQHIHLNKPGIKYMFYDRFNWFLSDMTEWLSLLNQEFSTYGEPGFFDLCQGEQDKKLKPIHDSWRKDWFSEESYDRWCKEHPITFKSKFSNEETNEREKDEDIWDTERKADVEREERFLREKCPTCKEQCEWYKKQTQKGQKNL